MAVPRDASLAPPWLGAVPGRHALLFPSQPPALAALSVFWPRDAPAAAFLVLAAAAFLPDGFAFAAPRVGVPFRSA